MQEVQILLLSKEYAQKNSEKILELENNWKEIGDEPWNISNLMYELSYKWELSYAAIIEGKIVGYQVGSFKEEDAVFLNKIVVDKSFRNAGIGKKLLKAFLEKALNFGKKRIIFRVRTDNPAVNFYDKLGCKRKKELDYNRSDGVASYYYDNKIETISMNL